MNPPDDVFTLEIDTQIDPSNNTKLSGLYRSNGVYCTQCEAEGFRRITYFIDRPDNLSVYTTRIEAEKTDAPILLSNGNLVETSHIEGTNRHYAIWHDPFPKPSYLFAVVGGILGSIKDNFNTMSGRNIQLSIYVEKGKESRANYAMDALKRAMRWDEEAFGREYDLEVFNIVAVSDFNMGAMENKGLNIFNDKYILASPDTATDHDYAGIEAVIAHEYFHNWTGNRVTCRDWFQLCLKEGLTVFRDQEFSADQRSHAVERISDVRGLRQIQFPEDSGPLAHPVRPESYYEINNFYTSTVYEKGAEIIRMLRTLIGRKNFRLGMDLYFQRFDGVAATVENFLSCFSDVSGRDLSLFARWYSQAGTPILSIENHYDPIQKKLTLRLRQETRPTPQQAQKDSVVIPIKFAIFSDAGEKLTLISNDLTSDEIENELIEFAQTSRKITFDNIPSLPIVSALRDFSAPVRLFPAPETPELERLLTVEDDPFNRWQSTQNLALRAIFERVEAIHTASPAPQAHTLISFFKQLLSQNNIDNAFIAQALTLPSENDIAVEMEKDVDPDIIFLVRKGLRAEISGAIRSELNATYHALKESQTFKPDATGAGDRSLRAITLDLIAAGNMEEGEQIANRQFFNANNMTDRLSALVALSYIRCDSREQAFEIFYAKFSDDPLVIDKWFALQAMIPETETIDRVKRLVNHKDFSLKNPNRVRSLIGAFTNANLTCFHALDGSGYELLTNIVLELDTINPQIAARLLSSLRSWKTFEIRRRNLIQSQLNNILSHPSLSPDVKDIATRAMA
jgi:aminopeptidase N